MRKNRVGRQPYRHIVIYNITTSMIANFDIAYLSWPDTWVCPYSRQAAGPGWEVYRVSQDPGPPSVAQAEAKIVAIFSQTSSTSLVQLRNCETLNSCTYIKTDMLIVSVCLPSENQGSSGSCRWCCWCSWGGSQWPGGGTHGCWRRCSLHTDRWETGLKGEI